MNNPKPIPGRAMTNEHKRAIVERLLIAWTSERGKHLRLGQLIDNANASKNNNSNTNVSVACREDEDMALAIEHFAFVDSLG